MSRNWKNENHTANDKNLMSYEFETNRNPQIIELKQGYAHLWRIRTKNNTALVWLWVAKVYSKEGMDSCGPGDLFLRREGCILVDICIFNKK